MTVYVKARLWLAAVMCFGIALAATVATAPSAYAQSNQYVPTIWVDPDGCEHWVMDDGTEGYMTPHVNRQGIPVCNRGNVCGLFNSDALFGSGSASVNHTGVAYLQNFFASSPARGFIIIGHTDSRASDEYNLRLSLRRANTVASIAQSVGAPVLDVRGYGERYPRASNKSAHGRAQNRRVEIMCVN